MLKVVFDTNIYISAFVMPGGNAERAFVHAIEGEVALYTSVSILTELARKLEEKFGWEKGQIERLITFIGEVATVLKTTPCLKVLADDPDNRILECALESGSDFLVTGDKHLLRLTNYENFQIIKLSTFLKILERATDA